MMRLFRVFLLAFVLLAASTAEARPRSGSSFGGLRGFRSSPSGGGMSRGYSSNSRYSGNRGNYGGGSSFIFLPSFGWGAGGWGYGGGMGMMGSLLLLGIIGIGAVMVVRSVRRAAQRGTLRPYAGSHDEYDDVSEQVNRAYVYKVQLGIGRSGRGIQKRLEEFAASGDTSTETGLAELLRQTALELMREQDSVRYGLVEPGGPYNLTNGESKLNGAAMAERSRFQIERVRGNEGQVRRSDAAATVGAEVLEYLVVTVLLATRQPVSALQKLEDRGGLEGVLGALGGVPANALLGLEVVWTPADPDDSLTETDLMTTYPEMRSL